MLTETKSKLARYSIRPTESLGQHFLVDEEVLRLFANSVVNGAHVVEVGPGTGNITNAIAERASSVTAIEIDDRYKPILDEVERHHPNVTIFYDDILQINMGALFESDGYNQVVANLPFHITEPFMQTLVGQPIESAVLLLGDNIVRLFMQGENSSSFGRLSLLAQTFFGMRSLSRVSRTSSYPQPRTDSDIIEMEVVNRAEINADPLKYTFARLFTSASNFPLVGNVLRESIREAAERSQWGTLDKRESRQRERAATRRVARLWMRELNSGSNPFESDLDLENSSGDHPVSNMIDRMGIDASILSRPFLKLDNQDLRQLVGGIKKIFRG